MPATIAALAEPLGGMAMSAFVREAVLCEADTRIAADTVLALSEQKSRRFLAAVDGSFSPNAWLKKAMEEASRLMPRRAIARTAAPPGRGWSG